MQHVGLYGDRLGRSFRLRSTPTLVTLSLRHSEIAVTECRKDDPRVDTSERMSQRADEAAPPRIGELTYERGVGTTMASFGTLVSHCSMPSSDRQRRTRSLSTMRCVHFRPTSPTLTAVCVESQSSQRVGWLLGS
jgi:hypothetical protein